MMSVAVGTKGSLKRNERKYRKKAEKQQKGDILENSVSVCHNVFCMQFCHVRMSADAPRVLGHLQTGSCKMTDEDTARLLQCLELYTWPVLTRWGQL